MLLTRVAAGEDEGGRGDGHYDDDGYIEEGVTDGMRRKSGTRLRGRARALRTHSERTERNESTWRPVGMRQSR